MACRSSWAMAASSGTWMVMRSADLARTVLYHVMLDEIGGKRNSKNMKGQPGVQGCGISLYNE